MHQKITFIQLHHLLYDTKKKAWYSLCNGSVSLAAICVRSISVTCLSF